MEESPNQALHTMRAAPCWWAIRMSFGRLLIMQKQFAQTARPEILQLTNDPDANVRGNAAFALRLAFPENGTPALAKGDSSADESQPGHRK